MIDLLSQALPGAWLAFCLVLLAFGPGLVALQLAGHRSQGWSRLAMAPGVGIALLPLVLLWLSTLRIDLTGIVAKSAASGLAAALLVLGWRNWHRIAEGLAGGSWSAAALTVVVAATIMTRVSQAADLVVAPWVDGYHHTLIAGLIMLAEGVPSDWGPYLPVDSFYYHFGFHTYAAAAALVSGVEVWTAVLWAGQILNMAAILSVYALVSRLTRHQGAAVAAAAIPAGLFYFPAYFVTWGRYTQLAGMVVVPVAWVLLADGVLSSERRSVLLLAALSAAGLLLTHYRVFVFYLLGTVVIALHALMDRGEFTARLRRLFGAGVVGLAAAAPWIMGALLPGISAMAAASPAWYRAPDSVSDVPGWLFDVGTVASNRFWLALAACGAAISSLRWRKSAYALIGVVGLALVVVNGDRFGLPPTYLLPPFALAIGLYLPGAVGIGLLADEIYFAATALVGRRRLVEGLGGAAVVMLVVVGAGRMRTIVNPATIIATEADVEAAEWLRTHTRQEACVLVGATHWHLNTYRGVDGGYWLPVLAERQATMPAAFYNYGGPDLAREVLDLAEDVSGLEEATDDAVLGLLDRTGADYVYSGPSGADIAGWFDPRRLRRIDELQEIYARDGVYIFHREAGGQSRGEASAAEGTSVCRPVAPALHPAGE